MPDHFRASNGLVVRFISSAYGVAEYGVFLRRLNRAIRVRRQQDTGELRAPQTDEITTDEAAAAVAAVREYLEHSHAEFLVWQARQAEGVRNA